METKSAPISTVGLPEQRLWMERLHPQFENRIEHRPGGTFLISRGVVQPTEMNDRYGLRIEYRTRKPPKTWVDYPALMRRDPGERVPHTYRDGSLCLYRSEFHSDMLIARTIVPWSMLWLMFYEAWRFTGEWQGGGTHPGAALQAENLYEERGGRRG